MSSTEPTAPAWPGWPGDWFPAVESELQNLRGRNALLVQRITELEADNAARAARIDELALALTRQTARANRLSGELSAALNRLDRIVAHARADPRPTTVRVRPVPGRLFPAGQPSGVTPAPLWTQVFLVAVAAGAGVGILLGVLRPGQ